MPRLMEMFRTLISALKGHPCDKCGQRVPVKLVVDANPAGKRVDGRTGLVTKTYTVTACQWLCAGCR